MREFATPSNPTFVPSVNLTADVIRNATEAPTTAVFSRPGADGWSDVTASEFHSEVAATAKGLIAGGIKPGDRVAIFSKTRYEWTLLDYAIWFAGAVTVPIYETSSAEQVQWILEDSSAVALVAETAGHVAKAEEAKAASGSSAQVWCIDTGAIDALVVSGSSVSDADLETARTSATGSDPATLIYTSGTTGRPKGCILTHANFDSEIDSVTVELGNLFEEGRSTLLFLPLAHVFARAIQVGCFRARVKLGHSADIKNLMGDLAVFRPTFILAVPRVFEKVYNTVSQRAAADGKGKIFNTATDTAIAYSRSLDTGRTGVALKVKHALFSRLVYGKILTALGGECTYAVSGGAPLGERLGHFYRGIGLTILEGYGLTETAAAVTVNSPQAQKVGTVGRPIAGATARVADDGELLFKGGMIFAGYWRNETATAETIVDGWFHTGDIGEIDDEGFVRITGRKKELLVTAGGKNVAPAVLEDRLRANALVDQCMVVGDGQPFIAALVTIDPEALPTWAAAHGKTGGIAELADDPDLLAEVQKAVDDANKAVSHAESIRKFTVLTDAWTEEGGQLTPSLKLKRAVVMREFKDDVDALYA
ncbi:long-chain-fatty-acid--CoA ligase [Nocardioides baekrokdamisoli]|uniref:Acyl-CoA synthetase n=1 Tax=Nocardioides baekrokdamisoli TaxID=1804624 RepID=A0A3G9IQF9_9ACTN|nr:AMP-dependent synthetase/ligase [Nocardioides baekrokdamisoli]BBH18295.1 long-chain-fatty-acid--CoA ligase [Nocardioides baekrokdamisoli]